MKSINLNTNDNGVRVRRIIDVEDVTRIYGTAPAVTALGGVTFTIKEGEKVAIVGPSGSGKTTLLQIIGTLDRATSGTVRITGFDTAEMSDDDLAALRAHHIGFVFQQFFLTEHATILDNVADGLLYMGMTRAERRARAAEVLDRVGLADRTDALPTQLSGGQRQRVAIARALVGRPSIVLADEPTGNLDSVTSQAILKLIEGMHDEGATVIVITHDREIAARFPRQIEFLDGSIVADSSIAAMDGAGR